MFELNIIDSLKTYSEKEYQELDQWQIRIREKLKPSFNWLNDGVLSTLRKNVIAQEGSSTFALKAKEWTQQFLKHIRKFLNYGLYLLKGQKNILKKQLVFLDKYSEKIKFKDNQLKNHLNDIQIFNQKYFNHFLNKTIEILETIKHEFDSLKVFSEPIEQPFQESKRLLDDFTTEVEENKNEGKIAFTDLKIEDIKDYTKKAIKTIDSMVDKVLYLDNKIDHLYGELFEKQGSNSNEDYSQVVKNYSKHINQMKLLITSIIKLSRDEIFMNVLRMNNCMVNYLKGEKK
jgi:hypothetical protein